MVNKSHSSAISRSKMPVSTRAKQFMPFHAQPGLDAALAAVEAEMELDCDNQPHSPSQNTPYHRYSPAHAGQTEKGRFKQNPPLT